MSCELKKNIILPPSLCDETGRLSIPGFFSVFMDLASEHAHNLKVGGDDLLKNGLFWIIVKTKLKIYDRPEMFCGLTLNTWPEAPERVKCNRYYRISDAESLLAEGKSEWAVIGINDGKIHRISEVMPDDISYSDEKACDAPYATLQENLTDFENLGPYTVRSTDIDIGNHMNNVAYVRAMLSLFTCDDPARTNVTEADISFKSPSYENEVLEVKIRRSGCSTEIRMIKENGKTAAAARLVAG